MSLIKNVIIYLVNHHTFYRNPKKILTQTTDFLIQLNCQETINLIRQLLIRMIGIEIYVKVWHKHDSKTAKDSNKTNHTCISRDSQLRYANLNKRSYSVRNTFN